jgi:hypothetical protein
MSALDKQISGNHYKDMPIQPIEFITKNKLDWYQGNIVKYASRHHSKGGADDLRKVIHYAELALEAQYGVKDEKLIDNNDWIEWPGADEPPITSNAAVDLKFRNGHIISMAHASNWSWEHNNASSDIIAYRVI